VKLLFVVNFITPKLWLQFFCLIISYFYDTSGGLLCRKWSGDNLILLSSLANLFSINSWYKSVSLILNILSWPSWYNKSYILTITDRSDIFVRRELDLPHLLIILLLNECQHAKTLKQHQATIPLNSSFWVWILSS
jgi:hypothetical protein